MKLHLSKQRNFQILQHRTGGHPLSWTLKPLETCGKPGLWQNPDEAIEAIVSSRPR